MARLFGTDGVRGVANVELTPELAFKLGRAAATYFGRETTTPKIIIGRDTRLSGTMLEAIYLAGDSRKSSILGLKASPMQATTGSRSFFSTNCWQASITLLAHQSAL